jgi:hypothetical protein
MLNVEFLAPVLGEDSGFGETGELLEVQQLVGDTSVEGLANGFCPRRAGLDVADADLGRAPVAESIFGQLGP